jgi:hypothetical protein
MSIAESNVVQIGSPDTPRYFNLTEANETLPLVKKITAEAYVELQVVKKKLQNLLPSDPRVVSVEQKYEAIVRKWISKMERLGLVVKGLWLVDFDTGDGYLCWKYPELEIAYFHCYTGGFAARQSITEVIEETSPDWA